MLFLHGRGHLYPEYCNSNQVQYRHCSDLVHRGQEATESSRLVTPFADLAV